MRPPFLLRGVARIIDMLVFLFVLNFAGDVMHLLPFKGWILLSEENIFYIDVGMPLATIVFYNFVSEAIGGATLGKLLTGIRTVSSEGAHLSIKAAAIRSLALCIDGFIFGLVAYSAVTRSEDGLRVGDSWAGTQVVWKGSAPQNTVVSALGAAVGIAASAAFLVGSYVVDS